MAARKRQATTKKIDQNNVPTEESERGYESISLTGLVSGQDRFKRFHVWIVGDTPIITHAWSNKAKKEMLSKQVKATKPGKDAREPDQDFVDSLYPMTKKPFGKGTFTKEGIFGFPATGVKNCITSAAHKDKGIPRTDVMAALWLNSALVRVMPAKDGAICDMPLIRIWGSEPEMREDMVKIGKGLNKTANLAYRAQFKFWAMRVTGRYNPAVLTPEALAFLIGEAGLAAGLGEWRNEKKGMFGAFHMADLEEHHAWEKFAAGKGPLPKYDTGESEFLEAAE